MSGRTWTDTSGRTRIEGGAAVPSTVPRPGAGQRGRRDHANHAVRADDAGLFDGDDLAGSGGVVESAIGYCGQSVADTRGVVDTGDSPALPAVFVSNPYDEDPAEHAERGEVLRCFGVLS